MIVNYFNTTNHKRRLFFFLHMAKDELHPSPPLPLEVGPLNTAK